MVDSVISGGGTEPVRRRIVLINPFSRRGHLDSYARLYSQAFLELGCEVVLVAESDAGAPAYIQRRCPARLPAFRFLSFESAWAAAEEKVLACWQSSKQALAEPPALVGVPEGTDEAEAERDVEPLFAEARRMAFAGAPERAAETVPECRPVGLGPCPEVGRQLLPIHRRAQIVLREEGAAGVVHRCVAVPARIVRRIVVVPASTALRSMASRVARIWTALGGPVLRPVLRLVRRLGYEAPRVAFEPFARAAEGAACVTDGRSLDLVVILYLDLMTELPKNIAAFDEKTPGPWVGILFHPRAGNGRRSQPEGYFRSSLARGGIFLVPHAPATYRRLLPHQHFALAPDVADLELPDEPPALAKELARRAAGRTIVLQIGSIAPYKGIVTLLDVIAKADPSRFFFALVGAVHWESFAADESRIRRFYEEPPENVLAHPSYVEDEAAYNGVIAASDIVYAVYQRYNDSSNSLTKAAGLRRPILVSAGTMMAGGVLSAGIGAVTSEGNADAIISVLTELAGRPKDSFGFDAYASSHSLATLKSVLAEALPHWCSPVKSAEG